MYDDGILLVGHAGLPGHRRQSTECANSCAYQASKVIAMFEEDRAQSKGELSEKSLLGIYGAQKSTIYRDDLAVPKQGREAVQ